MSFKNVNHWIFDLDNTLYPSSSNLFSKIDVRMKQFIIKHLSLNPGEAHKLQKKYYVKYGPTLNGLMLKHSVNPKTFLDYVHDINIENINPDKTLCLALKNLSGIKYIYTNGSKKHALRVLKKLKIKSHFKNIYDIESANFIPKPDIKAFKNFIKFYDIPPLKAAFFEDIARNLINAKKIGLKTILLESKFHPDNKEKFFSLKENEKKYIDHITSNLGRFLNKINLDNNS